MPRRFSVEAPSSAAVGAILAAFADPAYWESRFAEFGGGLELTSLEVDDAGTVAVQTLQDVRREGMHPLIARLYPRELRVVATERWTPTGDAAEGVIALAVHGAPGSGAATVRLTPAGTGSVMAVDGEVRVRVPVLGGAAEKVVAGAVAAHVPEMQRFTEGWVAAHG